RCGPSSSWPNSTSSRPPPPSRSSRGRECGPLTDLVGRVEALRGPTGRVQPPSGLVAKPPRPDLPKPSSARGASGVHSRAAMPSPFPEFAAAVRDLAPRVAVVLGSGLAGVTAGFRESASVPFGDIPELVPPTVHGHKGRLAVGGWAGIPALVFFGRLHFYEGHPWDVVTGTVRVVADLGARTLLLTNAAGGIHPSLGPGSLMAIRGHLKLTGPGAWRDLAAGAGPVAPYSARLIRAMQEQESAAGREL